MLVTKEIGIDVGHRVPFHGGKCKNFHGHRYQIELGVDDKLVAEAGTVDEGMVIDFSELKRILTEEAEHWLDHNSIYYDKDPAKESIKRLNAFQDKIIIFVDFIPTAENLAKELYRRFKVRLDEKKIKIAHVKIWETPTSSATYHE